MTRPVHQRSVRRRVIVLNRFEDRAPGRVAYAVYRGRSAARSRRLAAYLALTRWAQQRRAQIHYDHGLPGDDQHDYIDLTDGSAESDPEGGQVADSASAAAEVEVPDETWTKGQIYELARELDIRGRSKLDKAALFAAVQEELEKRPSAAETETTVALQEDPTPAG